MARSSSSSSSDSDMDYKRNQNKKPKKTESSEESTEDSLSNQIYGPCLPSKSDSVSPPAVCGPQLPPHLAKQQETKVFGPVLPQHLIDNEKSSKSETGSKTIGPFIPPHLREQLNQGEIVNEDPEEDECYGPLPPEMQSSSKAHAALEERALLIKLGKFDENKDKVSREEWMIELPEVQAGNLGLGPRQFRSKPGPDLSDRTSWTNTPNTKPSEEKVDLKKEAEDEALKKRDKQQEVFAKKANKSKKRDKSLYDEHQDALKKKKKEDEQEGPVRKPFNRETDLKVNRFDEAQKKAIMKKAQLLDDRFSKGKSKFL